MLTILLFLSISELLFSQYTIYNYPDVAEFKIFESKQDGYGFNVVHITIRSLINNEEYLLATRMNYNTQFLNLFEKDLDQDDEMEYILIGACPEEIKICKCYIVNFVYATKKIFACSLMGSNSSSDYIIY